MNNPSEAFEVLAERRRHNLKLVRQAREICTLRRRSYQPRKRRNPTIREAALRASMLAGKIRNLLDENPTSKVLARQLAAVESSGRKLYAQVRALDIRLGLDKS